MRLNKYMIVALISSGCQAVGAEMPNPDGQSFHAQCPLLLARVESFVPTCIAQAKSVQWRFDGAAQSAGVYFDVPQSTSHFQLGCTLGPDNSIASLGVFYAVNPHDFTVANDSNVIRIKPNGDVTFAVDKKSFTLLFIRQFVTNEVKPGNYHNSFAKNCADERLANGWVNDDRGGFAIDLKRSAETAYIKSARGSLMSNFCTPWQGGDYVSVPPSANVRPIATDFACKYFVMDDGSLLIAKPPYEESCVKHHIMRDTLIDETCGDSASKTTDKATR